MKIPYRSIDEYIPVDIEKLRPKGSYKSLIEKRTYAIDALVEEHGCIPNDLLMARPCPTCGSLETEAELEKDHLKLVRCWACDLVYVDPLFDEDHYNEIYRSETYQEIVKDLGEASHEYRVERFGEERVDIMARYLPRSNGNAPRYLDVGCSTGFVVEAAHRRGWQAKGIDLNPSAIEFGRSRGLDLQVAALVDAEVDPGSLDAISLFDVLEHLVNPRPILDQACRMLKPEGIVFLYVPNYDSASRLLMGKNAHFIWPTHHLNYYSPSTICDLVQRCGLKVELVTTEGLDISDYLWFQSEVAEESTDGLKPIADKLQFFINAGGYGKNLRALARKSAA